MRHTLFLTLLLLSACQSPALTDSSKGNPASEAWSLWESYRQCRTTTEPDRLQSLIGQLEGATISGVDPPAWLAAVGIPVTRHPLRASVDPVALGADCTLRAASQFALNGQDDEARRLYRRVLTRYRTQEMEFYRAQAGDALRRLDAALLARLEQAVR
jgi:hypothetical protein